MAEMTSYNSLTDRDIDMMRRRMEAELAVGNRAGMGNEAAALRGYGQGIEPAGVPPRGSHWTRHATRGVQLGLQGAAQGMAMQRKAEADKAQMGVYQHMLDNWGKPQGAMPNALGMQSDFSGQAPDVLGAAPMGMESDFSGQQPAVGAQNDEELKRQLRMMGGGLQGNEPGDPGEGYT